MLMAMAWHVWFLKGIKAGGTSGGAKTKRHYVSISGVTEKGHVFRTEPLFPIPLRLSESRSRYRLMPTDWDNPFGPL